MIVYEDSSIIFHDIPDASHTSKNNGYEIFGRLDYMRTARQISICGAIDTGY